MYKLCLGSISLVLLLFLSCNKGPDFSTPEEYLVNAYEVLKDYSYYQDDIPALPFSFHTPSEMYYTIPDTLRGNRYTFFVESVNIASYLKKFTVTTSGYSFGMRLDVLRGIEGRDTLFCVQVYQGSEAEKAGLKAGDKIVAVDSFPMFGNISVFDAVTGYANDKVPVSITVSREGGLLDTLSVLKGTQGAPISYSAQLTDQVGYIYLSTFMADDSNPGGSSAAQFARSLDETKGFPVTIIDLRGNGGGYVSQADTIASYFLGPNDTVIITNAPGPSGDVNKQMEPTVMPTEPIIGLRKFVLLADGGTASASEILISTLRYNLQLPLVGDTTYGKAIGQVRIPHIDVQSKNVIAYSHLTVAKYYRPDSTSYEKSGIHPDVFASSEVTAYEDPQLAVAIAEAEKIIGVYSSRSTIKKAVGAHNEYNKKLPKPQQVFEIESIESEM